MLINGLRISARLTVRAIYIVSALDIVQYSDPTPADPTNVARDAYYRLGYRSFVD